MSGSSVPKLSATGSIVSYGTRACGELRLGLVDVARLDGGGEGPHALDQHDGLRVDVAVVAGDRGLQLRVGAGGDRLAADAQHAGRGGLAARAAERVLAGLERERERARQARDQVLLLAQDARAFEDLELADPAGAGVGDIERHPPGVELQRRGRAAGVGELEGDGPRARVVGLLRAPAAGDDQHEQQDEHDGPRCHRRAGAHGDARGPQHVQRGRDQEDDVADQLRVGRQRLPPEHPGQQRRRPRARHDQPREIQRLPLAGVQPARLVRAVQRARHQPRCDEHEHEPGDAEEAREVQPHAAAIDQRADRDRAGQAEHRTKPRRTRIVRVLEDREQEDHGLQPFADHGEERHRDERGGRARCQRRPRALAQLPGQPARVAAHPHDHEAHDPDRGHADHGLQPFLPALRQLLVEHLEQRADGGADDNGRDDPDPHRAQGVAPTLLAQEAGDDADDERGLDPLPEADHETGQHELGQPKRRR